MPMVRGLLARSMGACAIRPDRRGLHHLAQAAYRNSPCVEVLSVALSLHQMGAANQFGRCCRCRWTKRTGQLFLLCANRNLVKGQAGRGCSAFNLMAGPARKPAPLLPFYP